MRPMITVSSYGLIWAVLLALPSCAPSPKRDGPDDPPMPQRTFSEEDRRIAQLLSLGKSEISETSSPQAYAMLCMMALDALAERMKSGDLLTADQERGFIEAQAVFRQRATKGLAENEQVALRNGVKAAHPEPHTRARFAIGCLRDLVGS